MKVTVCKGCKTVMEAVDTEGKPACPICIGSSPDSGIPEEVEFDPAGAKCVYCKMAGKDSRFFPNLPFLDVKNNNFYCGCRGWD